jgi:hypothetical protein
LKISGDILVTGGKWKNSSIIKVLIILFGHLQIHFWQISTGVVDTGGKFAAGIIDTGGKFANWWQKLPPVSLIPVANLPLVSLIQLLHLDLRLSPRKI